MAYLGEVHKLTLRDPDTGDVKTYELVNIGALDGNGDEFTCEAKVGPGGGFLLRALVTAEAPSGVDIDATPGEAVEGTNDAVPGDDVDHVPPQPMQRRARQGRQPAGGRRA